ncbi:MAG: ABC transporter permease [Alphaproteobacteria bacterium]|jgi:NitT/TauT family transport system permease protein|nr:ABC transporter permease [Alphaproteobacteria bacterium]
MPAITERVVPFRARGFAPRDLPVMGAASIAGLVLLWQIGSSLGWISPVFLPAPLQVAQAIYRMTVSGELWRHLSASLWRIALGWTLGTLIGVSAGFAMGLFTLARSPMQAFVGILFPVPKIALVPLFVIWFGIDEASKIATIAIGVFFPTVISTAAGVEAVQKNLIRLGQSFNLTRWSIITKIILPGALPSMLAGFRITLSVSILLLVAAEMIGAQRGLGAYILRAGDLFQTDQLIGGVVVLAVLGLAFVGLLGLVERRLLRWR